MPDKLQQEFNRAFDRVVNKHAAKHQFYGALGSTDGELLVYDDDTGAEIRGYCWARISVGDQTAVNNRVVRCTRVQRQFNLPVIIGYGRDGMLEVIEEDVTSSLEFGEGRLFSLPEHRHTHGLFGTDPLFIDGRQDLRLLCHPTEPVPDLNVYVRKYHYIFEGVNKAWLGDALDLSSHVPTGGAANEQQLVIVCLDPSTNTLSAELGLLVTPFTPDNYNVPFTDADIVNVSVGDKIRIAAVRLITDMTQIGWQDIFIDLRSIVGPSGSGGSDTTALYLAWSSL